MLLRHNPDPMISAGDGRIHSDEIDLADLFFIGDPVMGKEVEHWRPVDTVCAWLIRGIPPVARALLLVHLVIVMESGQLLDHGAFFGNGYVVVGIAMKRIYA